ncbi:N-acetylglucosamine-6-phosphate deacetylase [Testudinibacter sp. TR-2022]|uniref:N-acetylglucosamine-6-phosphate deacetylase n=1 Tax=Testudinibacter sp. TR-2022 TaxID=2585029 RepID=UPI00111A289C|nr:amidohydrolase family protein [Testudinibacter sp. TR-2022]TNH05300.1 amidohydrolase family protein [Pasteurellaceae bacterium Phil11]TNH22251.1 amidohydrolase family protein [Testudinibacter sp. TR-2022]TNH25236.1 amidohydrolase family protein [Testudinibacter sp. TR-2022]
MEWAIKSSQIVFPDEIKSGYLVISNERIQGFYSTYQGKIIDYTDQIIMPGFIDIHIHGWGRGSFSHKGSSGALSRMSKDLVHTGTTAYLATSGAMPNDFLEYSLAQAADYIESATPDNGAEAVGIHMEGPYINSEYLGMQSADSLQLPSISGFEKFNQIARGHIRSMTLAPELEGGLELTKYLRKQNITVAAGHTAATFDEITRAIKEADLNHFTHSYSAMRGFHHRELGVVGALMYYQDVFAEVAKQTGITIKPEAFDILYRLKTDNKMVLTTDCVGFADFPAGSAFYHYLRKQKFKTQENGYLRLENSDGSYSEIDTSNYEAIKNLEMSFLESVQAVFPRLDNGLLSVARIASENPAYLAGISARKGSLDSGKDADILVLDNQLNLLQVYCRGIKQI